MHKSELKDGGLHCLCVYQGKVELACGITAGVPFLTTYSGQQHSYWGKIDCKRTSRPLSTKTFWTKLMQNCGSPATKLSSQEPTEITSEFAFGFAFPKIGCDLVCVRVDTLSVSSPPLKCTSATQPRCEIAHATRTRSVWQAISLPSHKSNSIVLPAVSKDNRHHCIVFQTTQISGISRALEDSDTDLILNDAEINLGESNHSSQPGGGDAALKAPQPNSTAQVRSW